MDNLVSPVQVQPPNQDAVDPIAALHATSGAVKGKVDPQTVVNVVKTSGSIDEATTNIQAIVHSGNVMKIYDALGKADQSQQANAWTGLSQGERDGLTSLGYTPPKLAAQAHVGAGGEHGGWWSDVVSGLDTARHDTAHGLDDASSGVGQVAGQALRDLNKPLDATLHGVRATMLEQDPQKATWNAALAYKNDPTAQNQAGLQRAQAQPGASWSAAFTDPGGWAKAWRTTQDGNLTILPTVKRVLDGKYGASDVSLAERAITEGPSALVSGTPQAQQQAMQTKLDDPKFQQLVDEVKGSQLSVGRQVVGPALFASHPALANTLSGLLDGATDVVVDPVNIGARAAEATKLARYGATDASRVADILKGSSGQRLIKQAAPLLEQGRYGELYRVHPALQKIAPLLKTEGIDSGPKLETWLSEAGGMRALMEGQAAKISHGLPITPHLTYLGWQKQAVKNALTDGIDTLIDRGNKGSLFKDAGLEYGDVADLGDPIHADVHASRLQTAVEQLNAGTAAAGVGRIQGMVDVPRWFRRLTTLIPSRDGLTISDPLRDSAESGGTLRSATGPDVENFRRAAQGILSKARTNDLVNLFVASDEGQRRLLVEGLHAQIFHAAGLYKTSAGRVAADDWLSHQSELARTQAYSVDGNDALKDDSGLESRHALGTTQLSSKMHLMSPQELRRIQRDSSMLSIFGVHPMNAMDRAMQFWRMSILARFGTAVRFAEDESGSLALRTSPRKVIGAFLANGAKRLRSDADIGDQVKSEVADGTLSAEDAAARTAALKAMDIKQLIPYHPAERALSLLAERVPEGVQPFVQNFSELYGSIAGATTRKWARGLERGAVKALGLDYHLEAGVHMMTHQPVHGAMDDYLAGGVGEPGQDWSSVSSAAEIRKGDKMVPARMKRTGSFSSDAPTIGIKRFKWAVSLDQIARDKLFRAALNSIDEPHQTQIDSVLRVLQDPSFAAEKQRFAWATKLQNQKIVNVDATQQEADESWARQVVRHVNSQVREGAESAPERGSVLHDLVDHMLEHGSGPSEDILSSIPDHRLPGTVFGPDVVPVTKFEHVLSRPMEEVVGKPLNWLTRQPHLQLEYAEGLDQARQLAHSIVKPTDAESTEHAEQLASDIAYDRAINNTIPYIHNPELRTQFEDQHRNLFPFLFAQRQFLQRWGRTFMDSPTAVRELQLTMNGLRTTGIVRRDSNGNDYFHYWGAQYITEMLSGVLNKLGINATIPFAAPFTGEVKYLIPGVANPVTPSIGPGLAVAMNDLAKFNPAMTGLNQKLQGQGAAVATGVPGQASLGNVFLSAIEDIPKQVEPTILSRLIAAWGPATAGSQLASTTMQAMKYLDNAGQGLSNNPTQGQIEQYVDRVEHWSREVLTVRAVLGFALPATPTLQLDPNGLSADLRSLLNRLPYDQAVAEFVKQHPDATAYTEGTTKASTEGGLPTTADDLKYTNEHAAFAESYPAAFPWLAPRSPGTYSLTEFAEQLATGQRTAKDIFKPGPPYSGFTVDIINARAAPTYYQSVTNYEKQYAADAGNTAALRQLTSNYDAWKASFVKRNPMFNEYLSSEAGHVSRVHTINQVSQALKDPTLPASPATPGLKTMIESWNNFKDQMGTVGAGSSGSVYDDKLKIKADMVTWGTNAAKADPSVADFWSSILLPEVDSTAA